MSKQFGIHHNERGWFVLSEHAHDDDASWTQDVAQATKLPAKGQAEDVVTAILGGQSAMRGKIEAREIPQ